MRSVITWNKKHLLKKVEENILQLLHLKLFLFSQSKATVVYFGLYESSLHFCRRKNMFKRIRFIFLHVDI